MPSKIMAHNFIGLSIVDALLTKIALEKGFDELNPVVNLYIEPDWLFISVKVVVPLIIIAILFRLSKKYPLKTSHILSTATVVMLCVCIWNSLVLS